MAGATWTAEREERLRILWHAGVSLASIGGALGVSARAVQHKCSAFGLRRRVSYPDQRKDRGALCPESAKEIA